MIMRNIKKHSKISTITLVLMLTLSTVAMVIPNVAAQKITATARISTYHKLGVNTPTRLAWRFSGGLLQDPAYKDKTPIFPNAVITLTRPDSTTDVINGPFNQRPNLVQGRDADIVLIYTPDMVGEWAVNFYWPGDSSYDEIDATDTFTVNDYTFPRRDSIAYLSMRPYPAIGVGQELLINAWVTPPPYDAWDFNENYTFTLTSPTGESTVVGPMDSEAPGTVFIPYVFVEAGEWTIKFDFPGDFMTKPSTVTRTITVQQDSVTIGYPDTPLPTDEWTYPINVQNREWRNIAGPWYQTHYNATHTAWNPYTEAPRSAHVLWKLGSEGQLGGFIGQPHSIQTGSGEAAYGGLDVGIYGSSPPSITTVMAGRGYHNAGGMIHCVDMRTGEELWAVEGSFDVGARRPGRRDAEAVLYAFGDDFRIYDAITGEMTLEVPGMAMTHFEDPYVYTETRPPNGRIIKWTTEGSTSDFESRVIWNVSAPYEQIPFERYSYSTIIDDVWIAVGLQQYDAQQEQVVVDQGEIIAINTTTGEYVVRKFISDPNDPTTWIYKQGPMGGSGYGVWYQANVYPEVNEGRGFVAFDITTGDLAWVAETADYPWGNFYSYMPEACGHGLVFGTSYGGIYAWNATNGDLVWHYIAEDPYNEEPYHSNIAPDGSTYGSYSFGSTGPIVGGGVIFAPNTEHSPTFYYRGQELHAVDVYTGEKVWSIKGVYRPTAIAYGIVLAQDSVNGFTYAFSKGNTETNVLIQDDVYENGRGVLIKGTVLDMSPAQPGTPCISDEYMTEWMEYLHMQQPLPMDATGVPVELFAEKGGVTYTIGSVMTDCDGIFKYLWYPPDEGAYNVFAVFNGDDSYYSSYGIDTVAVEKAVSPGEPITPEPPAEAPFPTTEVAIILAVAVIAVVGIVAYWTLRRRK